MQEENNKSIIAWLTAVCLIILLIVFVGGMTRLTGSGLSIVRWELFIGIVPPKSNAEWVEKFEAYQNYEEYKTLNPDMTLDEFKFIFTWEYVHRLLGRILGLFYFGFFLYFLIRKRLNRPLALQLLFGFFLLALQGILGWFMVASGLKDNPHVSHYRLAAHLLAAFILFAYLIWILLNLLHPKRADRDQEKEGRYFKFGLGVIAILLLQIAYGAFVAGTKAGFMFNTFPKMLTYWIPPGLTEMSPVWLNLFENRLTLQFIHRGLAWLLLAAIAVFWFVTRNKNLNSQQTAAMRSLVLLVGLQFILGVLTLVLNVPIAMAIMHQVNACLLLGSATWVTHAFLR